MTSAGSPSDLCSVLILRNAFFYVNKLHSACPECPPFAPSFNPEPRGAGRPLSPPHPRGHGCLGLRPRAGPAPAPHGELSQAAEGRRHTLKALSHGNSSWSRFSCFHQYGPQIRCCNSECLAPEKPAATEPYVLRCGPSNAPPSQPLLPPAWPRRCTNRSQRERSNYSMEI